MSRRHDMAVLALVALATVVVALAESLGVMHEGLLHVAPALVLLVPLCAGRYLGEERLDACRKALAHRPMPVRPPSVVVPRLPRAPRAVLVRGARLLAASLAERGPPALAPAR